MVDCWSMATRLMFCHNYRIGFGVSQCNVYSWLTSRNHQPSDFWVLSTLGGGEKIFPNKFCRKHTSFWHTVTSHDYYSCFCSSTHPSLEIGSRFPVRKSCTKRIDATFCLWKTRFPISQVCMEIESLSDLKRFQHVKWGFHRVFFFLQQHLKWTVLLN